MTRGVIRLEDGDMAALITRGQWLRLMSVLSLSAVSTIGVATAQSTTEEEGTATLYSDRSEGRKTASGEVYDKKALTAAHRKYAYGTRLRVTNLANGKSAVVTVNDRMKRTAQGVIEVTPRVARLLGFAKSGTARVRVELVK
jgi:peptidoglycan lytic transglycosylase